MTVLALVDRRMLGAFRCVDAASGRQVEEPLRVISHGLDLRRNASGIFVVFDAPGLHALTIQFDADAASWPAPGAVPFEVSVFPATRTYLPRRASLRLPRRLAPMSVDGSVMVPADVPLYVSPAAVPGVNWAVIRASVTRRPNGAGIPFAMLRLTRDSDGAVMATGMTNRAGEALLTVPGVGRTSNPNGGGAVITPTVDTTVTAIADPALVADADRDPRWLPNPDSVLERIGEAALRTVSQAVKIGRGTQSHFTLPIAL